ncbi:VOC family protein [Microbulbifer sp. THAF38]|uniref:VOC family protein n=1 Tax=Microbulbifer sp. THAF38 TaxID=2587856 RepID=UPI00126983A4|nr:VOC family protein [Microbulbifer sp. THAF38]QFT56258.1 Glyoxalase/Bleomycin resistance protein/Dioxygenase superfamily protein [Microbulbifer sp. THAF38]
MFKIQHIDHVVLRVKSLAAMRNFYEGVLGCTMERENQELGLYQLRAGHALIDLVPVDQTIGREGGAAPGVEGRNLHHFCLRIDPFEPDKIIAYIKENNIEPSKLQQRYGAEGMGPSIYISDPEQNLVELKGPPDESK